MGLDDRCTKAAFSCGVVGGLLISIVPIVVAVLSLLLWRLWSIRRRYARRAKDAPEQLVETLSPDRIVGRNGLCDVLQRNLQDRDPDHRRPQLLVGDVGVGKTAVLVRLTKLLALRGAVPVPIRLREAQAELDFLTLARERFLTEVEQWLLSEAEGDKIWRKLLEEDRIVVLADGLEEALIDERSRDTTIGLAFTAARRNRVPLVVTARAHDAMRYADAAVLRLEPLSEGAAVTFIGDGGPERNGKLHQIVEKAEVGEAPVYMQLTRQLQEAGLLDGLDPGLYGRLELRLCLLDRWRSALVDRQLVPEARYTPRERDRALQDLEALACAGLAKDTLEVAFDEVTSETLNGSGRRDFRVLLGEQCSDLRFAASVGGRLDVVEPKSTGVRFRHSIIQAYLGSRRLGELLGQDSDYLERALLNPGREALLALVMFCRREAGGAHRRAVRDVLKAGPGKRQDAKLIEMLAAAVEIDAMIGDDRRDWIEHAVRRTWMRSNDEATKEAKLHAVARLGERREPATAAVGGRQRGSYTSLWHICVSEDDYAVRLAAAQHLAAGGSPAFEALQPIVQQALHAARTAYAADEPRLTAQLQRELGLQGWILPLLTTTATDRHTDELTSVVGEWIDLLGSESLPPSIEVSWAQGFKYEANVRAARVDREMRAFIRGQAARFAPATQFWFSRINLLHACTLWRLSQTQGRQRNGDARRVGGRKGLEAARRVVQEWGIDRGHPFVDEAASLCELALASGQPARYVWIDEAGVVSKLGPNAAKVDDAGDGMLWISQAAGWLALNDRARRLVGEIVVLLNLADRTDASVGEERLRSVSVELPPCMTSVGGRAHLRVDGKELTPGSPSACHDTCALGLCPYPAPGADVFRGELSEAFCREQLRILGHARGRRARWQKDQSAHELRKFWNKMEARARS